VIDSKTFAISEYGHWEKVHSYLVIGDKCAALIDTGIGIGNIRSVVDKLTSLPIKVITTHVHWDHIGGHGHFNEIYVHELETDWLENGIPGLPIEVIRHDVSRDISKPIPVDFRIEDYEPFRGKPTAVVMDNYTIDLGSRVLTCFHTPGHSPGHLCIYEEESLRITRINEYTSTEEHNILVDNLKKLTSEYDMIASRVFSLKRLGLEQQAVDEMQNLAYPKVEEIRSTAQELINIQTQQLEEYKIEQHNIESKVKSLIYIIGVISILLSILISTFITRSITRPINQFINLAQMVTKGDLTNDINIKTKDEISVLAKAFNTMIVNLRNMIAKISEVSEQVAATSQQLSASSQESAAASEEISTTINDVAKSASDQAIAITESNYLVNEIESNIGQMSSNMNFVDQSANATLNSAQNGLKASKNAVEKINNIKNATIKTSKTISMLNESSKQIENIVYVISAISDQTNLLALNAAIEAARAGDAGRGFAVVAEEVRKLAEQSSESSKQIGHLISDIQNQIQSAVHSMDMNNKEVDLGVEIVNKSSNSFSDIFNEINSVSNEIHQVLTIAENIVKDTNKIADNFESMSALSQQTAASTEQASASSEEQTASMEEVASSANNLAAMAEELLASVSIFKY